MEYQGRDLVEYNVQRQAAYEDPNYANDIMKYQEELRVQNELTENIQRIKTPMEKLSSIPLCRLDVGVCESLAYEFGEVCLKISYVLLPRNDSRAYRLRNWDLWGPFVFVLLFAFFIDNNTQLTIIILSSIIAAAVIKFTIVALEGRVSFLQCLSILHYCIFPIYINLLIQKVLDLFQVRSEVFDFALGGFAVIWGIFSVRVFIGVNVPENKKFLAVYPAALYYFFIGLMLAWN